LLPKKIEHQPFSDATKNYAALFAGNDILFEQRVTAQICEALRALWADPAVKEVFQQSREYQLIDSAEYFFNCIERVAKEDYSPTDQDLLRARARTTGITEITFEQKSVKWRVVDVGGQRSERKKWIHCFQDVTALIFLVAMSEYDLKLYEDERVNRMHESITLFEEICNCPWFQETAIILFLNKSDLFREKIKSVDLKVCFEEYKGGNDYDKAVEFLKQKFTSLNKNKNKVIFSHVTCATDTSNIKNVFKDVSEIIFRESLRKNNLA